MTPNPEAPAGGAPTPKPKEDPVYIESEGSIEARFIAWCTHSGIVCKKLQLNSEGGWPDRTLLYKGRVMFIELKRFGERPTPLQRYILDELTKIGFTAVWADTFKQATVLTEDWKRHVDNR